MRWWTSHAPLLLQTTSSQPVQLMHPLTSAQEQIETESSLSMYLSLSCNLASCFLLFNVSTVKFTDHQNG